MKLIVVEPHPLAPIMYNRVTFDCGKLKLPPLLFYPATVIDRHTRPDFFGDPHPDIPTHRSIIEEASAIDAVWIYVYLLFHAARDDLGVAIEYSGLIPAAKHEFLAPSM